jgi:chemosensory pili system protein ChpA (sensor histidine kinase/response regulator)
MSETQDHSKLKWIKGELDAVILRARDALEKYIGGEGDSESMMSCAKDLHQVYGTLQIVELYGATMLAEEMELVACAIAEGSVEDERVAAEALMQGLVRLPDYLEKLQDGALDHPTVIMPFLNDLRAARGSELFSEVALSSPQLERRLAAEEVVEQENAELPKLARKLRHQYHLSLLKWFRGSDQLAGIDGVRDVLEQLHAVAGTGQVKRLLHVAIAALAAPLENLDAPNIATKLLFGRVDRELKRIIKAGEGQVVEAPAISTVRDLLYYVASVKNGDELVQSVKQEFDLENTIISQQRIELGREDLAAPNVELLESLKEAIGAELSEIKDVLDLFIRTRNNDSEQLSTLEQPMRKVADTLGMISQGALRQRMKRQADKIKELSTSGKLTDESDLLEMAGDIIFVEASLENLASFGRTQFLAHAQAEAEKAEPEQELPEGEFERLTDSVVREARVDMAKIKDAILAYIKTPEKSQVLEQVPTHFYAIAGAFEMLKLFDLSALLRATAGYVSTELVAKKTIPDIQRLNAFADAITSIEYFMETIADGRGIQNKILDVAREALVRLGTEKDSVDEEYFASAEGEEAIPGLIQEEDMLFLPEQDEVAEQPEDEIRFKEEVDVKSFQEHVPSAEKPSLEDVDPEILDIFIEEAQEELEVIREYLSRWLDDVDDTDALITFRRSFHTLKGSGRLVGAKTIGEFAWSIENLLNRVIDQTLPVTQDVTNLLIEAKEVLPSLIDCQARAVPPEVDVQPMIERATQLATPDYTLSSTSGAHVDHDELEDEHESSEEVEETIEEDHGSGADVAEGYLEAPITLDPTLLEIFSSESRTHIDTINNYLNNCKEMGGVCALTRDVSRAFHTLHGSAHMAGVDQIAELSAALETHVNELLDHGGLADRTLLELIERSDEQFEAILNAINVPGAELPDWQGLLEDIENANNFQVPADGTADEPEDVIELTDLPAPLLDATDSLGLQQEDDVTGMDQVEDLEVTLDIDLGEEEINIDGLSLELDESDDARAEQAKEQEELRDEHTAKSETKQPEIEVGGDFTGEAEQDLGFVTLTADEDLITIFIEESIELMDDVDHELKQWNDEPYNLRAVEELQRTLHTLKGGARLSGITPIGDLSHAFESLLAGVGSGDVENSSEVRILAQGVADTLMTQIEEANNTGRVEVADEMIAELNAMLSGEGLGSAAANEPTEEESFEEEEEDADAEHLMVGDSLEEKIEEQSEGPVEDQVEGERDSAVDEDIDVSATLDDETSQVLQFPSTHEAIEPTAEDEGVQAEETDLVRPMRRFGREQLRVNPDLMDKLVNNAGEVSIFRSRLEQQNGALGFNLEELKHTVSRLRDQLRKLDMETEAQILFRYDRDKEEGRLDGEGEEFDPLEMDRFSTMQQLSRGLLETVGDLSNINKLLEAEQKGTETLLVQQSRITTDLQDGLMRTRMVSFSQLVPRLQRIVRQTCKPLKKQAELKVIGADMEMDRSILDRMTAPLEHLLRNAISHGIELPEQRLAADKAEVGTITIKLTRNGNDVVMSMSDDGRGLDFDAIKQRAVKRGLLLEGVIPGEGDLTQFILEHGFSTVDKVSQISGRGVGLDVVVSEIKQLGGTMEIGSNPGTGTEFTIYLPLTLAITDALLLKVGSDIYAVPYTNVEAVVRINKDELLAFYEGKDGKGSFTYGDHDYIVRYLGTLLGTGMPNLTEQKKRSPMLLVRAGKHRIAIHVDDIIGHRQIVVKSVGPQLSTVRWITGGTILGDGRVALILDINALVRKDASHTVDAEEFHQVTVEDATQGIKVMVVDDSITVRKVTGRLLERHSMDVETAKDGVDALAMLQDYTPDVMLLDIEMPRMDGFEVARHMRNSEQWKDIPIIIITSRTGEKHRKLAMDLGVKCYLGKPYQEADLMDNIQSVLEESRK